MENLTNKKKHILFIGSILLCGAFFLLSAHKVSAINLIDQESPYADFATSNSLNAVGQQFIPIKNSFSAFAIWTFQTATSETFDWWLCAGDAGVYTQFQTTYNCTAEGNILIATGSFVRAKPSSGAPFFGYNWATSTPVATITLVPGNNYYVSMKPRNNTISVSYNTTHATTGRMLGVLSTTNNLYYQEFYDSLYSEYQLQIITPEAQQIYQDFPNWQIGFNTATTSTSTVKVYYGGNQTNLYWVDTETIGETFGATNWALTKSRPLENGTYYAYANLLIGTSTVATTSITTFYINDLLGTTEYLGGKIKTDVPGSIKNVCEGIDTSSFYGGIKCGFMEVIDWAFTASDTTSTSFNTTYELMKTKAPFSAFYDLTDTIDTALATSTNMGGTFSVPMIRETATSSEFYMLPVMSSSSLPNAVGTANANTIRTTFSWLMYAGLAVIILIQII